MTDPVAARLRQLIAAGAADLPLPGSGQTIGRWRQLAAVAAEDVALAKLFEGHTDARAILAELRATDLDKLQVSWGTWAAEPPDARLAFTGHGDQVRLTGRKAWCSGADVLSHALVTAWDEQGRQRLAAVTLRQPGVTVTTEGWHAVGMGRVHSGDVLFEDAVASAVGGPGDYTGRPGFWHGGGGIAACWYGAAVPFAQVLAAKIRPGGDPHAAAHLGAVEVALAGARAVLATTGDWIDAHPAEDAQLPAMQARAAVEAAVQLVLVHAGRALGAGPLCRDASLAQRYADLPVFVRQSHAERDLAALGQLVTADPDRWTL